MLIPTIISGGAGARLWPLSRRLHPKSFLRPHGGHSLLQHAFLRAAKLPGVDTVLTITGRELLHTTRDHYWGIRAEHADLSTHFILEPFARNTAAAAALAAVWCAQRHGEDAVLLIMPADHMMTDAAAFAAAVATAELRAQDGKIVMFGIAPRAAESGYGYIEHRAGEVLRFIEKPPTHKAREYLDAGGFLWNSGMFCATAGVLLAEMATHCADILATARQCLAADQLTGESATESTKSATASDCTDISAESFAAMRAISLDHALMEHTAAAAVVACDPGWSDIGSWRALTADAPADADGNRITGEVIAHDSENCTIQSDNRVIGAVGLRNLLIIDTPDALLVADRARDQEVKHIYAALKARQSEAGESHRRVERQWGAYTVLDAGAGFKVKRLEVRPGGQLSLQSHLHRSEHWTVVLGVAQVTRGEVVSALQPNQSTYIAPQQKHRLENPAATPLVVIEVQMGDYLGEDDIVRYQTTA